MVRRHDRGTNSLLPASPAGIQKTSATTYFQNGHESVINYRRIVEPRCSKTKNSTGEQSVSLLIDSKFLSRTPRLTFQLWSSTVFVTRARLSLPCNYVNLRHHLNNFCDTLITHQSDKVSKMPISYFIAVFGEIE